MDIEGQVPTLCEIEPGGSAIMPSIIGQALRRRHQDKSLRYAFPLEPRALEQASDPATRMVALRTADGFRVCYSMRNASEALATPIDRGEARRAY